MVIPPPDDDALFDALYSERIRSLSRHFWTPVSVARRAAELLQRPGVHRVLDVGSGVGKFVLAAAASAPVIDFVGIEHRRPLIHAARSARDLLGIPNARFLLGDATRESWASFDAFYFFNPFAENLFVDDDRIDDGVELSASRFIHDVRRVEDRLRAARVGSVVVTYHGSTGRMPACYNLDTSEAAGTDCLRVWTKRRERDNGSFFVEVDDDIVLCSSPATPAEQVCQRIQSATPIPSAPGEIEHTAEPQLIPEAIHYGPEAAVRMPR